MIFYPNDFFNNVTEISYSYLKEKDIKALVLDVDNTLIDYDRNLSPEIIEWASNLKENGIKLIILSNSNSKEKVKDVANKLGIQYSYFGTKPLKRGFKKVQKILNLENKKIAVVGDQIFTDIIGANRMKMYSILVEPIAEKDIWVTKIKRPIENYIKMKYKKTKEEK